MKFIAVFLSVLVLSLTAMPCCALEEREVHIQKNDQKENHECPESEDNCCKECSPFYVCGTCIGFTFTNQPILAFTIQVKPVQHNTAYIPVELPTIPAVIWQPPKIG